MNETSSETNEQIDKEISMEIVPVIMNNNIQAITPKSMVPNPRWFDGNHTLRCYSLYMVVHYYWYYFHRYFFVYLFICFT